MAEIINLNRARKARGKRTARATAEANRAKHGRPRAEREAQDKLDTLANRYLDGHKREKGDD